MCDGVAAAGHRGAKRGPAAQRAACSRRGGLRARWRAEHRPSRRREDGRMRAGSARRPATKEQRGASGDGVSRKRSRVSNPNAGPPRRVSRDHPGPQPDVKHRHAGVPVDVAARSCCNDAAAAMRRRFEEEGPMSAARGTRFAPADSGLPIAVPAPDRAKTERPVSRRPRAYDPPPAVCTASKVARFRSGPAGTARGWRFLGGPRRPMPWSPEAESSKHCLSSR